MIYQFDDFSIDTTTFEARRAGRRVEAQPQVLELLIYLIENRDRYLSRDEIFANVWKGKVVSDAALSSRIKSARQLLGDDGSQQRYIRTIHGRGYRFQAEIRAAPGRIGDEPPLRPAERPDEVPTTRYARSGPVHIAYQQFGSGPVDLVLTPGFVSHIENYWTNPHMARWLGELGRMARVTLFDKRGTGLSDAVGTLPGLDDRMDDVRAVMDAAGLDKAYLMGISEGGSLASLFAATHPERCLGLVLYGAFARFTSWFPTREALQELFQYIESDWGSGASLPAFAPTMINEPGFQSWWGRFERLGATPGAAIALMTMNSEIDIADILPTIRVPALVIHRAQDVLIDVEGGRFLAANIPGARYLELPGADHLPFVGTNTDRITAAIGDFISADPSPVLPDTVLTTIVCIALPERAASEVGAELSDAAREAIRHRYRRFRGREIAPREGCLLAIFDGPARAIHCALDVVASLKRFAIAVRIGLHTGEVRLSADDARGVSVDTAIAIANSADPGVVLTSRTVRDLTAGAGFSFKELERRAPAAQSQALQLHRVAVG